MFRDILDHWSDEKLTQKEDRFIHQPNIAPYKLKTTNGWHFLVEWVGGTNAWERLGDLNNSYPMQVADSDTCNDLLNKL